MVDLDRIDPDSGRIVPRPPATSFDDAFNKVDPVDGWLSRAQARRLWECATRLGPAAQVVEIGSYRGRSTILLALAGPPDASVVAIDPHAGNDRGPRQIRASSGLGAADHRAFSENLERAGVAGRVRHVRRPSQEAGDAVVGPVQLLYIDGAHRYRFARDDLRLWGERVAPGGTLLVHDAFSSVGVTLALARCLFFSRRFRFVGRTRSLAEYRAVDQTAGARVRNAMRQAAELRWCARNIALKLAIVAHVAPLRRKLDPRGHGWPY
jgi:predicted O-methyltransferase YrrM